MLLFRIYLSKPYHETKTNTFEEELWIFSFAQFAQLVPSPTESSLKNKVKPMLCDIQGCSVQTQLRRFFSTRKMPGVSAVALCVNTAHQPPPQFISPYPPSERGSPPQSPTCNQQKLIAVFRCKTLGGTPGSLFFLKKMFGLTKGLSIFTPFSRSLVWSRIFQYAKKKVTSTCIDSRPL